MGDRIGNPLFTEKEVQNDQSIPTLPPSENKQEIEPKKDATEQDDKE
jgi:hypothetical protein